MKRIAAVIAVAVTTLPALAAWTVRPETVKVVMKKATRGGSAATAHAAVRHHSAAIVTENAATMVMQVPRARAAQLKADLLANADSVDIREELDVIGFRAHPIDVRSGAPSYPAGWSVSDAARHRDAFVIQFAAAPQTEWLEAMTSAGLRVLTYVPENAYVVFGRAVDVETIRDRYPVQFVSRHQPVHRISPELRTSAAKSVAATVVIAEVPEASDVRAFLEVHGKGMAGPVTDAGDRSLHRVTLDTATLDELAALPAVLWIEHAPEITVSGEREVYLSTGDTRTTISGTLLRPAAPTDYRAWLSGKGVGNYASAVKVAILDTGFDDGTVTSPHFDFRNSATGSFVELVDYTTRQLAPMSDCYGHGTAVAAVISGNAGSTHGTTTKDIGTDGQYLMGLGIAPAIPLVSGRVFNYNSNVPFPRGFDAKPWTTIYPDLASRQVKITSASINDSALAKWATTCT